MKKDMSDGGIDPGNTFYVFNELGMDPKCIVG